MNGHLIVVDLGYGDAGKGTIVDWLCARSSRAAGRPVRTVVRFNGGAQAAHHVISPSGAVHAFAQFGSGTFTQGTRTFLSRFMLVDPLAMTAEAAHLARLGVPDPFGLVTIDRDALLTTPYHQAANRAREAARGAGRHGSCGMGIGETASYALRYPGDAPRAGDLTAPRVLERKLTLLRDRLAAELAGTALSDAAGTSAVPGTAAGHSSPATGTAGTGETAETAGAASTLPPPADVAAVYLAFAGRVTLAGDGFLGKLLRDGPVIFEGAQGVLLDEWRGFHPYTTWSTTTPANAETLLSEAGQAATRLGVTRTYQTRHGPGPFPAEDPALPVREPHNTDGRWQGPFRAGHLDAVALRYAVEAAGGVDAVALTHLDTARKHRGQLRICRGYDTGGQRVTRLSLGPHQDLGYQQAMTEALLRARPVYAGTAPRSDADWADAIAEIVAAPVAVRSCGPAAADKTPAGVLAGVREQVGA